MLYCGKRIEKQQVMAMSKINLRITEMIACLWIILTLSSVAMSQPNFYTHGRYGKREESVHTSVDPSTFFSGSRYGRVDPGIKDANSNGKMVELLPRVDRFFLGSRYGKREDHTNIPDKWFISLKNIEEALKRYNNRVRGINKKSIGDNNPYRVAVYQRDHTNESNLPVVKSIKITDFPNLNNIQN